MSTPAPSGVSVKTSTVHPPVQFVTPPLIADPVNVLVFHQATLLTVVPPAVLKFPPT